MPTHYVNGPGGVRLKVEAPEGATQAQIVAYARANYEKANAPKPLTAAGEVKRGLGLAARNTLALGSQLLGIVGDPANAAINAATGSNLGPVSGAGDALADALGLPREQGNLEKATGAIYRGAGSALIPVAGATGAVARGGGATAQALASQPVLQTLSGGTAGLGSELVRQSGGGPLAQFAASLAGGAAPFAGVSAAGAAARPLQRFGPGFVERGASQILREGASNPEAARAAILARPAATPGTMPTTAEVARDAGIAGLQRASANLTPNAAGGITERTGANAIARQNAIDAVIGEGDTAAVSNFAARQAAALEAATGRDIAKVGALEPYDVSGADAVEKLEAARKASQARVSHAYDDPDIVLALNEPVHLSPADTYDTLPQPAGNTERAAFESAAKRETSMGAGEKPRSLLASIIGGGGINPKSALGQELKAMGITQKTRPGIFNSARDADLSTAARASGKRAGISDHDGLYASLADAGYFDNTYQTSYQADKPNTLDEIAQAIDEELRGRPRYPVDDWGMASERAARQDARNYWGNAFQEAGVSPEKMGPDDWDALYRDMQELPPHVVTQADAEAYAGVTPGKPLGPMQSALLGLKSDFYADGEVPSVINDAIRNVVNADVVSVRDMTTMSRRFRDLGDRADTGTDRAFLKAAADLVDADLRLKAGPDYADALKAAQAAARAHHDIFSRGRVGEVLRKKPGSYGQRAVEPADVTAKIVPASERRGAPAARQLKTALGDANAETVAREELRRALEKATRDGGDVTARIAKVAQDYAGALSEYPALADDVTAARETAATHAAFLRSALGSLRDGSIDVATKVASALGRGGNAELHGMVSAVRGDDAAMAGLRRAVAQYVVPEGPSAVVTSTGADVPRNLAMYKRISNALARTEGTGLFSGQQRAALGRLRNELGQQQFASSAARATGSDTAMNTGVAGKFMKAAAKAAERAATGNNTISSVIEAVAALTTRSGAIHEMVNRAMLDPDFAAKLLAKPSTAGKADLVRSLLPPAQSAVAGGGVVGVPANIGTGMASAAASTDQTAKDK